MGVLVSFGFKRGRASSCCFYHPERDIRCVVHGDDFAFTGYDEDLNWVQAQMESRFLCKVAGRLGPPPAGSASAATAGGAAATSELRFLTRVVRWTPAGLKYEADPRHAELLLRDLERLEGPTVRASLSTPCLKRTVEAEEEAVPLEKSRVEAYRGLAARVNYLALDRPDLAFAAKGCCRRMTNPSSLDWSALVCLARYVAGRPRLVYDFLGKTRSHRLIEYIE